MRAAQAMKAAKASKAKDQAKTLGLSVNTESATRTSASSSTGASQLGDNFSQIATAPAMQSQFKAADKKSFPPKESEALANPDWRTNRRVAPRDSYGGPVTGGGPAKNADVDTSSESLYGIRQYRTTPIDPDYIHSAPITNKDFATRNEGRDNQNQVQVHEKAAQLNEEEQLIRLAGEFPVAQMSAVRLEPLSSTAVKGLKAGLDYRHLSLQRERQEDGGWAEKWTCDNVPLTASPVEPSYAESIRGFNFPVASVKAIKESKRFKDNDWSEVPKDLGKNVANSGVPHTAGLPPDRLRQAYDQRGKKVEQTVPRPEESKEQFEKDQERFEALLNKLQKASAHRLREYGVDIKPPHWKGKQDVSIDSAVGDLGIENKTSAKPRAALNPLASEFQFTSQGFGIPAGHTGYPPGYKETAPSAPSDSTYRGASPSTGGNSSGKQAATTEDIQAILKSMNELKKEITQLKAAPQQPTSLQTVAIQKQLDYMETLADQIYQGMHAPTQSAQVPPEYGFGRGAYSGVPPYGGYTSSLKQYAPIPAVAQPNQYNAYGTYNAGPAYNSGASFKGSGYARPGYSGTSRGGTGLSGTGLGGTGFNRPGQGGSNYGGTGPNGMGFYGANQGGTSYSGSSRNVQAPSMPAHGLGPIQPQRPVAPIPGPQRPVVPTPGPQYPVAPTPGLQSFAGPPNSGPLPLHAQAQMAFGPKPVRKPKHPLRPGDRRATQKQQDYEQYLEVRRATDPEFARECRERQARRAERQRAGWGL
ncbi:hypothetical protein F5Y06DRAFT_130139 [Hypoxylon sp. FL0890]|nr:hypothetical protein F5Y06DRAFT_130139 [Hypoxylon sp. FL0890]